jgi:malate permease and related proteins
LNATFTTVISIFVILLIGYSAKKLKILKQQDISVINNIVINFTLPALIFVSTHGKVLKTSMLTASFITIFIQLLIMGAAFAFAKAINLDRRCIGGLLLVCVYGNTAYLGYPLISAIFPTSKSAMLTAVLFDFIAMRLPLLTIGVVVATTFAGEKFKWNNLNELWKMPALWAMVIALITKDMYIPAVLLKTFKILGDATTPMAMLSIGLSLSTSSLKSYPVVYIVVFILKMIALPLAVWFITPHIGVSGIVRDVVIIQSITPTAVNAGVIASKYGKCGEFAAGAVFLTTLASIGMIPLALYLIK